MDIQEQAQGDTISYEAEIEEAQEHPHSPLDETHIDYPSTSQVYNQVVIESQHEDQTSEYTSYHPQHETSNGSDDLLEDENHGFNSDDLASHAESHASTTQASGRLDDLETIVEHFRKLLEKQSLAIELQNQQLIAVQQALDNLQYQIEIMSKTYDALMDTKENTATLLASRTRTTEPDTAYVWLQLCVSWFWYATIGFVKKHRLLSETIFVSLLTIFVFSNTWMPDYSLANPELPVPVTDKFYIDEFRNRQEDALTAVQEELGKYEAAVAQLNEVDNSMPFYPSFDSFPKLLLGLAVFTVPIAVVQNLNRVIARVGRVFT